MAEHPDPWDECSRNAAAVREALAQAPRERRQEIRAGLELFTPYALLAKELRALLELADAAERGQTVEREAQAKVERWSAIAESSAKSTAQIVEQLRAERDGALEELERMRAEVKRLDLKRARCFGCARLKDQLHSAGHGPRCLFGSPK